MPKDLGSLCAQDGVHMYRPVMCAVAVYMCTCVCLVYAFVPVRQCMCGMFVHVCRCGARAVCVHLFLL